MSQEDKPVAEVLSTQVEAWQREVSALQEKIAFAIGKPVAAQEPVTESFVQTVPDHCDRIVWKGTYIHLPIANAAPCAELQAKITEQAARIKALEAELSLIKPNSDCDSGCMLSCSMEGKANAATIERQRKVVKLSGQALTEVQDLIAESRGVYGLHLNGDKSPWNEIEQGGWFERLVTLPEALAAIAEHEKGVV